VVRRLYTADRDGGLHEGKRLDLMRPLADELSPLSDHGDWLFPRGVSLYGTVNLYVPFAPSEPHLPTPHTLVNLLFEYVRRSHYADRPSRLMSVFACETVDEACWFAAIGPPGLRMTTVPIFEVEVSHDRIHRGDIAIIGALRGDRAVLGDGELLSAAKSWLLHHYWQGLSLEHPKSRWEHVVELPVTVGRQVATALPEGAALPVGAVR
jgi:hypothetical protein